MIKAFHTLWLSVLVVVLFISMHFLWFNPKITTLSFDLKSKYLGTIELYYNLGDGWNETNKIDLTDKSNDSNQYKIVLDLPSYPEQIQFRFKGTSDSVSISEISLFNNLGNIFFVPFFYTGSNNMDSYHIISESRILLLTNAGESTIKFNCLAFDRFYLRYTNQPWYLYVISIILVVLTFLFSYKYQLFNIRVKHLYLGMFLALIFIGIQDYIFHVFPTTQNKENRALSLKPSSEDYHSFLMELELYLQDHFSLRPTLSKTNAYLKYKLFGVSSQPNEVVFGEDDYMFPVALEMLADYQNRVSFSIPQLASITNNLIQRRDWLSQKGIPFIIVVPPNKHTVYPEKMAGEYLKAPVEGRMEFLLNHIKNNSDIEILDLRKTFNQEKNKNAFPLFYKYDMHWNQIGAYYGYREIMNSCTQFFPDLKPYPLDSFFIDTIYKEDGDLVKAMQLQEICLKNEISLEPKSKLKKELNLYYKGKVNYEEWFNPKGKRKLLMFRDSYGVSLVPLLNNHFEHSIFIWEQKFNSELIKREKPDIVIQEVAELFLSHLLILNPPTMVEELKKKDGT